MFTPTERIIEVDDDQRMVYISDGRWRKEWWHGDAGAWMPHPPGAAEHISEAEQLAKMDDAWNSGQPSLLGLLRSGDASLDAIDVAQLERRISRLKREARRQAALVALWALIGLGSMVLLLYGALQ